MASWRTPQVSGTTRLFHAWNADMIDVIFVTLRVETTIDVDEAESQEHPKDFTDDPESPTLLPVAQPFLCKRAKY